MVYIAVPYTLGVIVTLLVYRRYYHKTIPLYEMIFTWYYQLPVMLFEHYQYKKREKEMLNKRGEIYAKEFQEALKTAQLENWTNEDWHRWNESIDYAISLTIR